MSTEILLELATTTNVRILRRYLAFIASRPNVRIKGQTHHHHILPKSEDFFPQFKDLNLHPWNGCYVTFREHFIAHWMLARAFPRSSQSKAFYYLTNEMKRPRSKLYEEAKAHHIQTVIAMTQDPERNKKISNSLKGKRKSDEHRAKLSRVKTIEERQKISASVRASGFTFSEEQRAKMSESRKGKTRGPYKAGTSENISKAKLGKKVYNNGQVMKYFDQDPGEGWVPGRL